MNDGTTYLGFGCIADRAGAAPAVEDGDPNTEEIAVMQRGVCTFQEKADTAVLLGYDAYIIFNDAARGDALVTMAVESPNHPGIFVGHSTGKKLFGDTVPAKNTTGEQVRRTRGSLAGATSSSWTRGRCATSTRTLCRTPSWRRCVRRGDDERSRDHFRPERRSRVPRVLRRRVPRPQVTTSGAFS
jgi:hypothetical protein